MRGERTHARALVKPNKVTRGARGDRLIALISRKLILLPRRANLYPIKNYNAIIRPLILTPTPPTDRFKTTLEQYNTGEVPLSLRALPVYPKSN